MLNAPQDNLVNIFESSIRSCWDLPAVSDYGTSVSFTYGQMAVQMAKIQLLFDKCDIAKGDKIALMGRNNCNWVSVYLAALTYGAVIVPILQDFKPNDALHIINHSQSKLLFITDSIWEGLELGQIDGIRAVYSLNNFKQLSADKKYEKVTFEQTEDWYNAKYPQGLNPDNLHYEERSNKDIVSINYTSGTTGFSKGVVTSANALAGNVKYGLESHLVFKGCRMVAFLPLAHAYGCAIDFLCTLAAGGHTYFIGRTPAPKILLQAFQDVKPTLIMSVPLIFEKIYRKQIVPQISSGPTSWVLKVPFLDQVVLDKIRQQLVEALGGEFEQVIIGGAPMNAEVEDFFKRINFPFSVGYGMTECAPLISFTPWRQWKKNSCGQALPGLMEVKVNKPNADGIGELLVRGENVMNGYYKNESATSQVFTKDGWLKTGDLGYIDEEGFIFIKGRNKTMLLSGNGQNIYPEEIEAKLNNMPYVMESIVLQHEDHLVALVCPDYEAADKNHLTREQLEEAMEQNRKDLNQQLAAYEQINKVKLYPHEFEKTPKKSIKRFLYTQMAED